MKKLFALLAALILCATLLAGVAEEMDGLKAAKDYLFLMYRNKPETTPADYTVVGGVNIDNVIYEIEWTADSDTVKIIPGDNKMVTIDIDDKNPKEIEYLLTAIIKSVDGRTETVSFKHKVPAALILDAGMSYEEIVGIAYQLEAGLALEDTFRLFGTITAINTPYSADYQNITVTIQIGELADKLIQCYRLKGAGAEKLAVGDQITVEGILKNYKGTIEFDAGCALIGMGEIVSQQAILDAAYALEEGLAMTAPTVLSGEIISIDSAWSEKYNNITVTIVCDGATEQPIQCYRLAGAGAEKLAVGDTIAVAGTIKNYKGTIEFDAGCALIPVEAAAGARAAIAAYSLEAGLAMTAPATMTGVISAINTAYSADYKNITVTIVVGGLENYAIQCYRLKGEGAETLAVGDTVTVTGTLKNYKGTIEFDAGCVIDAVVKAQ